MLLLPVATRYEQEGGGTETTTERRIIFSPEIPRQVGEARSEWRLFADVAARVQPELADAFRWATNQALRAEIARGRAGLRGHRGRWPPPATRCSGAAATSAPAATSRLPDGRGRFTALVPDAPRAPRRRVHRGHPAGQAVQLDGARRRRSAHGSRPRRRVHRRRPTLGPSALPDGAPVRLTSDAGSFDGRLKVVRLPARSLQVHWPEGNVLISGGAGHREPRSKVPDYNAVVTVEVLAPEGHR